MKEHDVHTWQSFASENDSLNKLFEPLSKRLTECGTKESVTTSSSSNSLDNSSANTLDCIVGLRATHGFNVQDYSLSDGSVIKINASKCNDFSLREQEQINAALDKKGVFIVQI
ncbi:hypothetical protein MXE38_00725 [Anaerobiospirillum sp. NML120448]|uniref:hypothetical protein n=1 Tax=Anaerobiospirillum sp. NML120448 TaxID=2932816 RepID=UPI001FF1D996|nr:hypothetical protein [Anaerobiospirillum sp. NML120448]MCK0513401.1 hypothetical protein [Anaerobiospirillum sp. NML120448]